MQSKRYTVSLLRACVRNSELNHDIVSWPRGYKTFFMLNSVEHEILNAHKYKNIKKLGFLGLKIGRT